MNERLKTVGAYVLEQLRQASTWRGMILVATALTGWKVPEEKVAAITLIGLTAAGLVGMLFPDKISPAPPPNEDTKGTS